MNWTGLFTILLLIVSNVFMTLAWYGHLKLPSVLPSASSWPLIVTILLSWGIALFEYLVMIPANRMGSNLNGGPFNLFQLKIIQEVISLMVFTLMAVLVFRTDTFQWNHLAAMLCIAMAVFFVFLK